MSNNLKGQSSPYLLQHAENPVDWYPWCDEAFEKARREDKPVFLSIGYSTCHWCHVMAHESFENEEIADVLNKYFISVKVDREERPDIDSVYMSVCQAFTGSGGWPMSIFMTADQKPFFAGTYFPPVSRGGMVGMKELLMAVASKWKEDKAALFRSADELVDFVESRGGALSEGIDESLPDTAYRMFSESFDERYGGFGSAPKFPTPHNLIFLMMYSRINDEERAFAQSKKTLESMRRGGIFDHIGYGFSRYSTDEYYLVPHFEKMLYDNALLMMAYCVAYKISGDRYLLDTAEKTARYVFREMTGDDGRFYSAQDADSEGMEGRYYVWDQQEILSILGEEKGRSFCSRFGITKSGNFEGKSIPNLLDGGSIMDDLEEEKQQLYRYRKERMHLHLDDKVLTSWNSLMIYAMTVLYRTSGDEKYLAAAEKAQGFIEENLSGRDTGGDILYVSYRNGKCSVRGFLDDYAFYTAALIGLHQTSGKEAYLRRAVDICRSAHRQFFDEENGGYFMYGREHSSLITRPKETYDGAIPSGNSVMAYCLVRLWQLTGNDDFRSSAEKQLSYMSGEAKNYPAGCSMFLMALLSYFHSPQEITVVLAEGDGEAEIMRGLPLDADVTILHGETEEYKLQDGRTTYFVCRDHTCLPPTNELIH